MCGKIFTAKYNFRKLIITYFVIQSQTWRLKINTFAKDKEKNVIYLLLQIKQYMFFQYIYLFISTDFKNNNIISPMSLLLLFGQSVCLSSVDSSFGSCYISLDQRIMTGSLFLVHMCVYAQYLTMCMHSSWSFDDSFSHFLISICSSLLLLFYLVSHFFDICIMEMAIYTRTFVHFVK